MIFKIFQKPIETDSKFRSRCKGYENELTSLDYSIYTSGQDSFENCWRIETDDNGRLIPDKSELLDYLTNEMVLVQSNFPNTVLNISSSLSVPVALKKADFTIGDSGHINDCVGTKITDGDIEHFLNKVLQNSPDCFAVCSAELMGRMYKDLAGFNQTPNYIDNQYVNHLLPKVTYSATQSKKEVYFVILPRMVRNEIWFFSNIDFNDMLGMIVNIELP
jgi:hypothetical protein